MAERRGGRPRIKPLDRRVPMSTRFSRAVYEAVVAAAEANANSVTQELEDRIERSLRDDEVMARLDRIEAGIKALGALLFESRAA